MGKVIVLLPLDGVANTILLVTPPEVADKLVDAPPRSVSVWAVSPTVRVPPGVILSAPLLVSSGVRREVSAWPVPLIQKLEASCWPALWFWM